jgi:hypothetical protein
MIRRTTWILLAIFIVLLGVVLILQRTEKTQIEETTELPVLDLDTPVPAKNLFEFPAGEAILGLLIKGADGTLVEVQRPNESADWVLVNPQGEADLERIGQAVSQIGSIQISSTLPAELELDAVGLDQPAYTLRVSLSNGKKITAYIGDITISNSSYYARLAGGSPVVVGKYTVDQIVNLLTTPPIAPSPTPSPENDGQP